MNNEEESKGSYDHQSEKLGCLNQGPFTLIASDEDEDSVSGLQSPDLNRGYSDQKREYQKGLRAVIFKSFKLAESEFNF